MLWTFGASSNPISTEIHELSGVKTRRLKTLSIFYQIKSNISELTTTTITVMLIMNVDVINAMNVCQNVHINSDEHENVIAVRVQYCTSTVQFY